MKKQTTITLFFLFFCLMQCYAATYYVSVSGNDSNPGTLPLPFRTIQKGADVANAGDTVIVTAGTYVGAKFSKSGTISAPIRFIGQPGAIVNAKGSLNTNNDNLWIRNASYVHIEGFEVHSALRSGIAVQGEPSPEVHGIVIRNNYCHNNSRWGIFTGYAEGILIENNETSFSAIEHGIYVSNSADNPVIIGNKAHHNNASGIQINADPALAGDGIISNALIDSNIIYENGAAGGAAINLASVINSVVQNNLLYKNVAGGIAGWDDGEGSNQFGTHHNKIYNNTIVQPSNGRFVISLLNGSTNNEIKNNILIHLGTRGSINVDSESEPGLDSNRNAVVNVFSYNDGASFVSLATWQSRGHDLNSFISNTTALFVNASVDDYHLKAGSPAIDSGFLLAQVTDDLEGNPRPAGSTHDIGAYESGSGCVDTEPPSTSITSPGNGATVSGTITISANASDDCSVNRVEFFVDGNLIGTDTGSPYSTSWNTTTVANGSHSLTTIAYDNASHSASSSPVNVNVNNASVSFSDDFEDGNAAGWTLTGGTWSVVNGDLTGTTKDGRAISPNFGGCTNCTIETDVRIQTASGRASVFGWYQSSSTNVELQIQDDKNRYILKQVSGGTTVAQLTVSRTIATNTYYHIKMQFDGSNFRVYVDGVLIITLAPATTPSGIVGFRTWSPNNKIKTCSFKGIVVY
ncbi:Ig-like domain-containing protein [bacterium]|nr:Ig-like domain-containing protein [bacterium]